ncbi:MAG: hypothetical protein ACO3QV_07600 [Candidatus Nanopelagicaceae bacterium]
MEARMIPYSVHLREDIYQKLREVAKDRKATALVRDAITMIIEGDDSFNGGYNKALRDVISVIKDDQWATKIGVEGEALADHLSAKIEKMIVTQKVNS